MDANKQQDTLRRAMVAAQVAIAQHEALMQTGDLAQADAQADVAAYRVAFVARLCSGFGRGTGETAAFVQEESDRGG